MTDGIIQPPAIIIQAHTAKTCGVDPVVQQDGLAGHAGQLLGEGLRLFVSQRNSGYGADAQDIMVFVVMSGISLAAMGKVVHIALFRQNLQKIQKILIDFSAKTIVQDLAAFLLGNAVAAQKLHKSGFLTKAFVQNLQFVQNGFVQTFAAGKLIKSFSINASDLGHT